MAWVPACTMAKPTPPMLFFRLSATVRPVFNAEENNSPIPNETAPPTAPQKVDFKAPPMPGSRRI